MSFSPSSRAPFRKGTTLSRTRPIDFTARRQKAQEIRTDALFIPTHYIYIYIFPYISSIPACRELLFVFCVILFNHLRLYSLSFISCLFFFFYPYLSFVMVVFIRFIFSSFIYFLCHLFFRNTISCKIISAYEELIFRDASICIFNTNDNERNDDNEMAMLRLTFFLGKKK